MSAAFERAWAELLAARIEDREVDLPAILAAAGIEAEAERRLIESYAAFLRTGPDGLSVLGHLGQSLDGRIATGTGHSVYVTGKANLVHMHRLRALADVIIVGAGTVASDDPQLTTRLVDGPSPLRVVIDSRRRLGSDYRIFNEGEPGIVVCAESVVDKRASGRAKVVGLACRGQHLQPATILRYLRSCGHRRIFVEGGGVTVSRFLNSRMLCRLQLCVAPVLIGDGRSGISGPAIPTMDEAIRLDPVIMPMGPDMLYDCPLVRQPLA